EYYMPLTREPERGGHPPVFSSNGRVNSGPGRVRGSELPFVPLLSAIEGRLYSSIDAYYSNAAMLAPVHMARQAQLNEDLPIEARAAISRVATRLMMPMRVAATLKPEEASQVIADYLNEQRELQLEALDPDQAIPPEL